MCDLFLFLKAIVEWDVKVNQTIPWNLDPNNPNKINYNSAGGVLMNNNNVVNLASGRWF